MTKAIGIIGLGKMGKAYAENALTQGLTVYVYNRSADKAESLLAAGAHWCESPAAMIAQCDYMLCSLYDDQAAQATYFSENGITSTDLNGKFILENSTLSMSCFKKLQQAVTAQQGIIIDCPISGNPPAVYERRATFYVGCEQQYFERIKKLLLTISNNIQYSGDTGTGLTSKLCINHMLYTQWQSFCEALLLAEKSGMAPENFINMMQHSVIASPFLKQRSDYFNNLPKTGTTNMPFCLKDIVAIEEFAKDNQSPAPMLELAKKTIITAIENNFQDHDILDMYYAFKATQTSK